MHGRTPTRDVTCVEWLQELGVMVHVTMCGVAFKRVALQYQLNLSFCLVICVELLGNVVPVELVIAGNI